MLDGILSFGTLIWAWRRAGKVTANERERAKMVFFIMILLCLKGNEYCWRKVTIGKGLFKIQNRGEGRSGNLPSMEGRSGGGRSRVYFFFLREPVSSTSLRIFSSLSVGSGTTLTSGETLRVHPVLALISSTVAKGK